jgi:REP element-mobilizing transposase RayT
MKRLRAVTTTRREKRLKASKKQKRNQKQKNQRQEQELKQLELFRPRRSPAAAREHLPARRGRVPHSIRPDVSGGVHVVQRIARGLPELRTPRLLRDFERSFRAAKERKGFALTHYSVQRDHLHLVVEAEYRHSLARGMQALSIRIAKQLNSHWHRRGKGRVFAERYFATALTSWQQIWRTI